MTVVAEDEPVKLSTKISETATSMVQSFAPLKGHRAHLNALHAYVDDPSRQVEANHYCSHLSESIQQCLIYDSHDTDKARLIGVEYIIPETIYAGLPAEEQQYWHSHAYEILSGLLVMPAVPTMMEDGEMAKLVKTYGKTWHFWQVDRGDALPLGEPKLMCSFTRDGQANAQLVKLRDEKFAISTADTRKHRMSKIDVPVVNPKADQFPKLQALGQAEEATSSQYESSQQSTR